MRATPQAILEAVGKRRLALFLDYDGTLTPIVERPEDAVLASTTREVLRKLAQRHTVAIVSGRDLQDVRARVGIEGIHYAGSHGFDIAGPGGSRVHDGARAAAPRLAAAAEELARDTAHLAGVQVETKRFALAVHYRRAQQHRAALEQVVDLALERHPGLRKTGGKMIFELRPDVDWDKGRAVLWLLRALDLEAALPVYIGDDETDEDAFRALGSRGIGIAVLESPRDTAARYVLPDTDAVREFLRQLA